jgi:polyisoprenoid-binding protein YceI
MTTLLEPRVAAKTEWNIDPAHSRVDFSVRHMMVSNVKGHFGGVTGTIQTIDENVPDAQLSVEIDAASINTGSEQRDTHLKSPDFLDVEKFPKITFVSKRVEERGHDKFDLIGDLTIRDVTKEVVLHAEDNGRGKSPFGTYVAGFSGTTEFNRNDFGVKFNVALEAGGWLVGETVKVSLDIEAVKQGD